MEPDTRPSLMVRLRDPQDQQAWGEFVSIYEPLLLNVLRKRGLQEADARDVAQQVVIAVAQAVEHWRPDGREASFRRWLFTIARKQALKFLQRGKSQRGAGGSDMVQLMNDLPEPDHRTIAAFDEEYRNEIFHRAARQVRGEFRESTWQAFWRTCVESDSIAEAAKDLKMTAGSIYVARSRIIARLRKVVEEFEALHGE